MPKILLVKFNDEEPAVRMWQNTNSQKQFLRSVCSNESSVKLLYDMEAKELIFWEDPNDFIRDERKEEIESSLQLKGEALNNSLFNCISNWSPQKESRPFVKELMFVLSESVVVEKRGGEFDETLLMIAAKFDAETTVVKLMDRGAKLEAADREGFTALHYAVWKGNKASCTVLLQRGANVNAQTKDRSTPLMFAAGMGHAEVVKLLLEWRADTRITDRCGKTAIYYAKLNCAQIIMKYEQRLSLNRLVYTAYCLDGQQAEFFFTKNV